MFKKGDIVNLDSFDPKEFFSIVYFVNDARVRLKKVDGSFGFECDINRLIHIEKTKILFNSFKKYYLQNA